MNQQGQPPQQPVGFAAPQPPPAPPAPQYPAAQYQQPQYQQQQYAQQPYPAAQPGQYAAPAYGAAPAAQEGNGIAVAGFVCGLLGLLLGWFLVPLILAILGVVFGGVGINRVKQNPARGNKGLAIAGLTLGIIGIVLWGGLAIVGATVGS